MTSARHSPRLVAEYPGRGLVEHFGGVEVTLAGTVSGEHTSGHCRADATSASAHRDPGDDRAGERSQPTEARTAFPLYGSTESPARTTASAPAASAARITEPAFPGSRTSARTATSRGRCAQD